MITVKEIRKIRNEFEIYPVKFRIARVVMNLTLDELSKLSGISRKTISRIEKGECKSISDETFSKLVVALNQCHLVNPETTQIPLD